MAKPKKKTPTPRPAPIAWRFEAALAKARRGFTVEAALEVKRVRIRRRKGIWEHNQRYVGDPSWFGWSPFFGVTAIWFEAKWNALPKRSAKGLK